MRFSTSIFLLILITFFPTGSSEAQNLSNKAEISLFTCDPGDELFTIFGHSALMVYDPVNEISEVYNWGTFDFREPNFYPKFLRGKLLYTLDKDTPERFVRVYQYSGRAVKQEKLDLDSIQMNHLYAAVLENYRPENRKYLYDFLFDNCSTRIDEIINTSIGPVIYPENDGYTFRDQLHQYLDGRDWAWFGIDLIIGSRADRVCTVKEQMFLPDYLSEKLSQTKINGKKLVSTDRMVVNLPRKDKRSFWITPILFFTLLLILELILLKSKPDNKWLITYDHIWIALMAIVSIVLMFMWFGTDHKTCGNNYNLLAFSPLFIILFLLKMMRKSGKALTAISIMIIGPYVLLPFVKMSVQNIYPAVLLICVISLLKLVRVGELDRLRKFV